MASSWIVREIMKDYQKDRDRAERLMAERNHSLWSELPRVREIDDRLSSMGIAVARSILEGGDGAILTEEFSKESEELKAERENILREQNTNQIMEDVYTCPVCKDTGYVNNVKCACYKKRLTEKFYKYSNLGNVLSKENFDTFDMELYSNEPDPKTGVSPRSVINKAWNHALKFIDNFGADFTNLLFYGETGLGKTFLCNCIARELLDKGYSVIYATSPQLFKLVEKARFDKKDDEGEIDEFLQLLLDADLLIIDDLGTEMSTSVTVAELFNIINTRLMSRRPIIISTNYDIPDINARYSDRITSRVFGNFTVLKFAGDDIRIKIRYKT